MYPSQVMHTCTYIFFLKETLWARLYTLETVKFNLNTMLLLNIIFALFMYSRCLFCKNCYPFSKDVTP